MCARNPEKVLAARSCPPVEGRHERFDARAQCDEFITLASHELLTPVTALRLHAQHMRRLLAQHPEEAPARIPGMVETFDRQLGRLSLVCDELLQATQIGASELPLTCEEVALGPLVSRIVDRIAQRPDARSLITIRVSGEPRGSWDRALLEQLVLHLVRNALTFGEGQPVAIDVSTTEGGARLVVKDRGMGIAREDQARIFDRFERAVPSTQFGGLGLGLYIVRAVAKAHGGSVRVESAPAEGATFIVDLPAEPGPTKLAPEVAREATRRGNRGACRCHYRSRSARQVMARRPRSRAF
ncbi:sensor histidine kinase [Polyangium spumosum]|nr:HAMP domain-containing sensor histidine kinase [Polyangium spumosum]